jgi:hypothetical protein
MKTGGTNKRGLFDILEIEEDREKGEEKCPHRHEKKTLTVWPGETFERCTWTCEACGRIRGRA